MIQHKIISVTCPNLQKQFNVIEEPYVIFYDKVCPEEATSELESHMRDAYPILFQGNSEDEE